MSEDIKLRNFDASYTHPDRNYREISFQGSLLSKHATGYLNNIENKGRRTSDAAKSFAKLSSFLGFIGNDFKMSTWKEENK